MTTKQNIDFEKNGTCITALVIIVPPWTMVAYLLKCQEGKKNGNERNGEQNGNGVLGNKFKTNQILLLGEVVAQRFKHNISTCNFEFVSTNRSYNHRGWVTLFVL